MVALVCQTRLIKNGRFCLARVLKRWLDQLKLFFLTNDDIQAVLSPSFRNIINMSLFSNTFMQAPKGKGEAFQRSKVVPRNNNN